MTIEISKIVQGLEPSATLAMSAKAKELTAQGKTVYDLSVGEPDFITPQSDVRFGITLRVCSSTKE
jgi:aspartate aminotransferase